MAGGTARSLAKGETLVTNGNGRGQISLSIPACSAGRLGGHGGTCASGGRERGPGAGGPASGACGGSQPGGGRGDFHRRGGRRRPGQGHRCGPFRALRRVVFGWLGVCRRRLGSAEDQPADRLADDTSGQRHRWAGLRWSSGDTGPHRRVHGGVRPGRQRCAARHAQQHRPGGGGPYGHVLRPGDDRRAHLHRGRQRQPRILRGRRPGHQGRIQLPVWSRDGQRGKPADRRLAKSESPGGRGDHRQVLRPGHDPRRHLHGGRQWHKPDSPGTGARPPKP